jgi:hypothetical protein
VKTPLPKCHGLVGYTEAQILEYGRAEFDRAVLLAMNATKAFGKTGAVIAVVIGHIKRDEA